MNLTSNLRSISNLRETVKKDQRSREPKGEDVRIDRDERRVIAEIRTMFPMEYNHE